MTNEVNHGTSDDLINLNTQGMDAIINSLYKDLPTNVAAKNLRHSTNSSFYNPSRRKVEAVLGGGLISPSLPHKVVQPKPRRLTRRRTSDTNEAPVSLPSKDDKKTFKYRRSASCDSGIMNLHSMMTSSNHHANDNHRGHQDHRHVSWGRTNVEVIDPEASPDAICKVHEFRGGIPPLPLCNTAKDGNNNNNGTRDTTRPGDVYFPQEQDEGGNPQEYSPQIIKRVTNLIWTDKRCGITGSYTGQVNFDNVPHGMGTFIANVDGSSISCQWDNGSIVVESLEVKEDKEKRGREMSRAKLNEHNHEGELSPTPSNPPAVAPTSLPGYHLGHTIEHRSHMIIPSTPEKAVSDADSLNPLDFCFIKRSNGQWTYSIVADRPTIEGMEWEGGCIRFVLDAKGSTKTIRRKYWERGIRLVNVDVVDQLLADVERAEREIVNAEDRENIAKNGEGLVKRENLNGGHERPRHPDTKPKNPKKKHRYQTQSQEPSLRRRSTIENENPSLRRSVSNHQPRQQNQAPSRSRRSVGSEKSSVRRSRSQPALHQSLTSNGDSDQAVIVPEGEANHRRKATGELDVSYVSKISDNAVILPDTMQDAVRHKYHPARKSSRSHSDVNTSSMSNSTSCYAVDAQPQHKEHWALYNQRGTIYKEVATKKYDGSQQRGSRHRTSQSCSPSYTKKTIPFTSFCSILKKGSDTEKKVQRRASFQDMTKEDLVSMIVGDENDKRGGSNTSASLGGVSLPASPMKRRGTNEKVKSGVIRRSSSASCKSIRWDLTNEEYPLQESILAMLRGNEDTSIGSTAFSSSRNKKKKDKRRASMSSGSSVGSNLSSLGGLLREMYTPEYLARAESKLGRSTSSERLN